MYKILFRTEVSALIGTGHFMRCLALAQALQDQGGVPCFALSSMSPAIHKRLNSEGILTVHISSTAGTKEDAIETILLAQQEKVSWIIIDANCFKSDFQKSLSKSKIPLLCIDDIGEASPSADIILNQNLGANPQLYASLNSKCRILLGLRFLLLRREFRHFKLKKKGLRQKVQHILVTLGGSDATNQTAHVLEALEKLISYNLTVTALIGPYNSHFDFLKKRFSDSLLSINLLQNPPNIPEIMSQSDLAICSGGTTVWELSYLGIPCLVGITSPIEENLIKGLKEAGIHHTVGWYKEMNSKELANKIEALILRKQDRLKNSQFGQYLIDGQGCDRVLKELSSFHKT